MVIGVIGGILSGLFAIGGAILMVPLLVWRAGMDQRRAAATSLVAITPTAVVSSVTYLAHGYVDVVAGGLIAIGGVAGAIIGSRLLNRLPLAWLRWIFIAFILIVATHMLFAVPERSHALALSALAVLGYLGLGVLTGIASGLFGIGGAIVVIPILVSVFAIGDLVAKGTALLVSIPTSVVGTIGNRRSNAVDVRAGLILGVTAAAVSVPAVILAVAIPPRVSGIMFAILLIAIASQLAFKALREGSLPEVEPVSSNSVGTDGDRPSSAVTGLGCSPLTPIGSRDGEDRHEPAVGIQAVDRQLSDHDHEIDQQRHQGRTRQTADEPDLIVEKGVTGDGGYQSAERHGPRGPDDGACQRGTEGGATTGGPRKITGIVRDIRPVCQLPTRPERNCEKEVAESKDFTPMTDTTSYCANNRIAR